MEHDTCPRCGNPGCGDFGGIPHESTNVSGYVDGWTRGCLRCWERQRCRDEARVRRRLMLAAARKLRGPRRLVRLPQLPLPVSAPSVAMLPMEGDTVH